MQAKTKIVCTLGPATDSPEMISKLIQAGMNVARVNFSHGERDQHAKTLQTLREESAKLGIDIAILVDLQGPKIRTNSFPGGGITLKEGEEVELVYSQEDGAPGRITTKFEPLVRDVSVGERILMDDGLLEMRAVRKTATSIICEVVYGGLLKNKKGINLPESRLQVPAMTEKDIADARFALNFDVDFLALSFVRSPGDVQELRKIIAESGKKVQIVAKIEKPEAIVCLDDILRVTDAVMVARGDLGVEIGNAKVPGLQKNIIKKALSYGVPVITATQMLESMIENPRPTRAEASDVANAIFDGTDAVMLSGETAVGKYPIETVAMMKTIIMDAERQTSFFNFDDWNILDSSSSKLGMSIGKTASMLANQAGASALACLSHTGNAAIRLTSQRPSLPVYMFSAFLESVRKMNLVRGAQGILIEHEIPAERVFVEMERKLVEKGFVVPGESVVYTAGLPSLACDTTNTIHIRTIEAERDVCTSSC